MVIIIIIIIIIIRGHIRVRKEGGKVRVRVGKKGQRKQGMRSFSR